MAQGLGIDQSLYMRCFTAKPYNQAVNYETWKIGGSRPEPDLIAQAERAAIAMLERGTFIRIAIGKGPLDAANLSPANVEILIDMEKF